MGDFSTIFRSDVSGRILSPPLGSLDVTQVNAEVVRRDLCYTVCENLKIIVFVRQQHTSKIHTFCGE